MTRVGELRELEDDELLERLESNKEELFNLRFQLATGQLDNPMRIKDVRHDVARILTVLRERDLAAELDALEAEETAVEDLVIEEPQGEELEAASQGREPEDDGEGS